MLTITRQVQIDFHIFNTGVRRARREYEAHPNEFSKAIYCVECSEEKPPTRKAIRCALCEGRREMSDAS